MGLVGALGHESSWQSCQAPSLVPRPSHNRCTLKGKPQLAINKTHTTPHHTARHESTSTPHPPPPPASYPSPETASLAGTPCGADGYDIGPWLWRRSKREPDMPPVRNASCNHRQVLDSARSVIQSVPSCSQLLRSFRKSWTAAYHWPQKDTGSYKRARSGFDKGS